ncbi:gamma-glutamyltransferase family protein [Microbispora sp. NPDC049125]|uniref:gamma-glutamyltransferase family protein n=1 Tax=Microbispora sp. NPDC049125 TaxID=3154929 RepID=UPI003467B8EF
MTETRFALNGMVCTVDHLASQAGIAMLDRGGNAADAAIAANAVLAVTSPHMCGLGGDLFALVHDGSGDSGGSSDGAVTALNASGRAGSGADPARLRAEGHDRMPHLQDIRSVPVPGCVDGWTALHERYGRLPLGDLLAPAIRHATRGFPASPLLGTGEFIGSLPGAEDFAAVRRPGDLVRRPGVARTLAAIAEGGRAAFYQGEFGEGLLALGRGEYAEEDLARPNADWVEPLHGEAFGHRIWTVPPNSQGYLLPLSLEILAKLDLPADPADPRWAHLLVESARAAGHDRLDVLYEGAVAPLGTADARRALIDPEKRSSPAGRPASPGDTTYLCVVDGDGMGVSLIQSNAAGFGSLLFEPGTGINLHNRGIGFSLTPGHPAEYGPGRRPPHTLCPALVTRPDGSLRTVIGTMGGDAQPQILLQLVTRLLEHGESPGEAVSAPRWALGTGTTGFDAWRSAPVVEVEEGAPWADGLRERGHAVQAVPYGSNFGHAHMVDVLPSGVLAGAADPRALIGSALGR